MDTVKRYLINEAKSLSGLKKVINVWQADQLKVAKKFEKAIKSAVDRIDDLEGLEDFRDMGLNNLAITPELEYAIRDAVDGRIDQIWQEMVASEK